MTELTGSSGTQDTRRGWKTADGRICQIRQVFKHAFGYEIAVVCRIGQILGGLLPGTGDLPISAGFAVFAPGAFLSNVTA